MRRWASRARSLGGSWRAFDSTSRAGSRIRELYHRWVPCQPLAGRLASGKWAIRLASGAEIPYLTDTRIEWSLDGAPLGAPRGGSKEVEAPGTGGAESRWIRGDT